MRSAFLDRLITRMDRMDKGSLKLQFLRLAQEKGLLEAIFEAIHEGLIVLGEHGTVHYINRSALKMLGVTAERAEGEPIHRLIKDMDWDELMNFNSREWLRMMRREVEINYPEHRFVEFYVVPLTAVKEGEHGAVIMLRDVTHERESTARSLESERLEAITLLAAGVAHEIGNPLNSLNIHLQLLKREVEQIENAAQHAEWKELIDVSTREVNRLDQIITQFLRALRPSLPERRPERLDRLLEETLTFMRHEIEDRGVLIETAWDEDSPTVPVDQTQIKQVFFNLIKNALQVLDRNGLLKISLAYSERCARICFEDNGPGISAEDLGTIYEPFKSGRKSGSGLGLMIVQRIVHDHGGEMEIHSEPNKGTTFILYIPREERRMRLLEEPRTRGAEQEGETV